MSDDTIKEQIQNEYKRIDNKWLVLHFKTVTGFALFSLAVEIIMYFILSSQNLISCTIGIYILKYIMVPALCNGVLALISYYVVFQLHCRDNIKYYTISLSFAGMCFVILSVHSVFNSLFSIFAIPIIMTTVYGSYKLTTITATLSLLLKYISVIYINWDPDKAKVTYGTYQAINFMISFIVLCACYIVSIVIITFEKEKNAVSIKREIERYQLKKALLKDDLTCVYNRLAFKEYFNIMLEEEMEKNNFLAMFDLDNFKQVNDLLGHLKGDELLKVFARIIQDSGKESIPFRFGGDEFCILFMDITLEKVLTMIKTMQKSLRNYVNTEYPEEIKDCITVSAGIAGYVAGMTSEELLSQADSALYQSKISKNSIHIYGENREIGP